MNSRVGPDVNGGGIQNHRHAFTAIMLAGMIAAVAVSLTTLPTVFVDDGAHPLGNDANYHAARMLMVADDPGSTYSFDPNLHWPEGTWITWTWGYDYFAGVLASILTSSAQGANNLIMFYPLVWLLLSTAVVGLVARQILTPPLQLISVLAYATAPMTLKLFGIGELDHHGAEHALFLLSMYIAGRFLRSPESVNLGIALGCVLAFATIIHNSMFIVQLPVIATLLLTRIFGMPLPSRGSALAFACSLLIVQCLLLLPSHAFLAIEYAYFYHSWFHLHVAVLTAAAVFVISTQRHRAMWFGFGVIAILTLPAAEEVNHGVRYLASEIFMFDQLLETQSPFGGKYSLSGLSAFYSALVVLTPLCLVYAGFLLYKRPPDGLMRALLVSSVFGLLMLSIQVRFFYLGHVFLIFLPLLLIQNYAPKRLRIFCAAMLFIAAYIPSINASFLHKVPGHSVRYAYAMPTFEIAERLCDQEPGLLLADPDFGSLFRYRSSCPLLSNNFVLTPAEIKYVRATLELFELTPAELLRQAPEVRYVFVSPYDSNTLGQLLLSDQDFSGYELVSETRGPDGAPRARLFRVVIE